MQEKNKSNKLLWIIGGIGMLLLVGSIVGFFIIEHQKNKQNSQIIANQETQELESQVEQIKDHLNSLDQTIQQDSSQLQEKQAKLVQVQRTIEEQNKAQEIAKLKRQIQELEARLAQTRKQKEFAEKVVFELEKEINNLAQSQAKQGAIRKIQQELNKLAQQLEIKLKTARNLKKGPSPASNQLDNTKCPNPTSSSPNSTDSTNQNNSNLQNFEIFRKQSQELITLLDKIIQDYEKRVKGFDDANQQAKEQGYDMYDMGEIGEAMKSIKHHLESAKSNKTTLAGYVSEKDYQTFLSASPETQKINLGLIEDTINNALKSTQENLSNTISQAQKMLKIGEEMLQGLEEGGLANDEELKKQQRVLKESKKFLDDSQTKLNGLKKLNTAEQIKVLGEVWDKFIEFDEKSKN